MLQFFPKLSFLFHFNLGVPKYRTKDIASPLMITRLLFAMSILLGGTKIQLQAASILPFPPRQNNNHSYVSSSLSLTHTSSILHLPDSGRKEWQKTVRNRCRVRMTPPVWRTLISGHMGNGSEEGSAAAKKNNSSSSFFRFPRLSPPFPEGEFCTIVIMVFTANFFGSFVASLVRWPHTATTVIFFVASGPKLKHDK